MLVDTFNAVVVPVTVGPNHMLSERVAVAIVHSMVQAEMMSVESRCIIILYRVR